jgi:surface antigen
MKNSKFISIVAAAAMLAGCTQGNGAPNSGILNGGGLNKTDVGTAAGVIGGGVLGSTIGGGKGKIAATILGAGLGGLIGHSIGQSLDNADQAAYAAKTQQALETGQPGQSLPWQGKNGASGSVTAGAVSQSSSGQYCREYTQTINVGGQTQKAYGTACRQPDGSWQVVSSN